jgi:hypothetical protein
MASNFRARTLAVLALGLAAALAAGCGGRPRAHVTGKVTLNGKPITDGSIEFFPVSGAGQSAGAALKDGAYQVEASVGEMRVTINSADVVGRQKAYDTPDSPVIDIVRNSVPARYNTESELRANLVAGRNEVNFDLTTGPKPKK